ncbi:hypothetical protein ACOACQ_12225 [Nocardioides sp. CPCC 206347]|uniref:hypothetical protein n=1 Tax=unclassified Nocardioides TaxID=2615069 RepID=UPI003613B663
MMSRPVQIACACSGFMLVVLLFGGLIAAGWMPPPSPSDTADEVARQIAEDYNGIRLGAVLMLFGAGFTVPMGALIAAHIKRIEGDFSPLAYIQIIGSAGGLFAISLPVLIFGAAAFRPDRDPDLLRMLIDLAWVPFIMNGPPAILQCVSWGVAILSDKRANPPFPRWFGYFNFWAAFCFLPAFLLLFFKTGPFAWNGLLSFWLAAALFGGWFLVGSVMLLRAVPPVETPVERGADAMAAT